MDYNVIKKSVSLVIVFSFYMISYMAKSEAFISIASAMVCFVAGVIVYSSRPKGEMKNFVTFLAIMIFMRMIYDFAIYIDYSVTGATPLYKPHILMLELIPVIFATIAVFSHFLMALPKLHKLQLFLDALYSLSIIAFSVYFAVFEAKWFENVIHFKMEIIFIWYFVLILLYWLIHVFYCSSRTVEIAPSISLVSFALIFVISSYIGVAYFEETMKMFAPEMPRVMYSFSTVLIAIAALIGWPATFKYKVDIPLNYGFSFRPLIGLVLPLLLLIADMMEPVMLVPIGISTVVYFISSSYTQGMMRAEILYNSEVKSNMELEKLVDLRTAELLEVNQQLLELTITDSLTNLKNRRYFTSRVEELIGEEKFFTLFYLDIEKFRVVNDIHGHSTGDSIIKILAARLKDSFSDCDTVARVDGDEFAIIQIHSDEQKYAREDIATAKKLYSVVSSKIFVGEYAFDLVGNLGIASYPKDSDTKEGILKCAILSVNEAKKNPVPRKFVFYNQNFGLRVERKNHIDFLLKSINYDEEFCLYYQPQVEAKTGVINGFEALIRWKSPILGFVSPAEFIKISEETGTINKISYWVMENAFKQAAKWNRDREVPFSIGVNISPLQFESIDFFPYLKSLSTKYGIKPGWIEFEITENFAAKSGTLMEEILSQVASLGFGVSIDDFGTGYSSLSYIKRFDIDRLKIAKELVDNIVNESDERQIVAAIILMAEGLKISTVAEGVEDEVQAKILADLGCATIQGYHYYKPMPVSEIEEKGLNL